MEGPEYFHHEIKLKYFCVAEARMNDSVKRIMREAGREEIREGDRERWLKRLDEDPEMGDESERSKSEPEKRHDKYRRQQEFAGRLGPAAERLPILTEEESLRREKERPKRRKIEFEGPIEKLIEKYKDPKEVFKHLSIGQLMKYELDEMTGCIYEKGTMIFDGSRLVSDES